MKPATTASRRMRLRLRLTQVEAAKLARVGLRTYQRVEAGDCLDRGTVRRVERALGLPW